MSSATQIHITNTSLFLINWTVHQSAQHLQITASTVAETCYSANSGDHHLKYKKISDFSPIPISHPFSYCAVQTIYIYISVTITCVYSVLQHYVQTLGACSTSHCRKKCLKNFSSFPYHYQVTCQ